MRNGKRGYWESYYTRLKETRQIPTFDDQKSLVWWVNTWNDGVQNCIDSSHIIVSPYD